MIEADWIVPDWPAPARVRSLVTTRQGGVSRPPYASLNLGDHVGDDPLAVAANRQKLGQNLPAEPRWLNQVHGTVVVDAASALASSPVLTADAAFSRASAVVCAVLTADCLPVLFCDRAGSVVAAAHAGWRGLQAGVLEQTVAAMGTTSSGLMAYLGPAIGVQAFAVGDEVRSAFVDTHAEAAAAFVPLQEAVAGSWLADLCLLARQRLARLGVEAVFGGGYCTVEQANRFFSYRREGATGRMASLIWLSEE